VADAHSLKTFAEFPRWRDLAGDARAWEMYRYLVDARTGLFHMNEVLEGDETVLSEFCTIRDPVKIVNVYGYGYCGILGPVMEGVAEGAGIGPARTLSLPGWRHVAAEAFYDGGWHYLDLDVRAVFRRPDGTLASMDDARRDASLWARRGPLFFPNDPLDKTQKVYQTTKVERYHNWHQRGHTMDFVLRQGETFTRWWTPQGGRWHHAERWNRHKWLRRLIEQEPRGPKPNHRHFTIHNYGNGQFIYEPNLTNQLGDPSRPDDFTDGIYGSRNVKTSPNGLTRARPGAGFAIFEVRSPYIIVPVVGSVETRDDDRGASVAELDAIGVAVSLSLDNGLTWHDVGTANGEASFDLTSRVSGRYGYLLKLGLDGQPGLAALRSLRLTTWVQVAPAALPSLRRGINRMEYKVGDHHGLNTLVVEVKTDASRPETLLKYLIEAPRDHDPSRRTSRVRGEAVAKIAAPPRHKIAWFSASGQFRTYQGQAASRTKNTIAYAVDVPSAFKEIYAARAPSYCNHWNYNIEREVKLSRPAQRVFVRYTGAPALNNIRLYAHCLSDTSAVGSRLVVSHRWREDSTTETRRVELAGPRHYDLECRAEPTDLSITLALPSNQ